MRPVSFLILVLLIISCKKEPQNKLSLTQQIVGTWNWESTCGGFAEECGYPSLKNNQTIEYTTDGHYIERRNDTLYVRCSFQVIDSVYNSGHIVNTFYYFRYSKLIYPILTNLQDSVNFGMYYRNYNVQFIISNNALYFPFGELITEYKKINGN